MNKENIRNAKTFDELLDIKSLLSGKSVKWLKTWHNILIMNTFFWFFKSKPPYFWE